MQTDVGLQLSKHLNCARFAQHVTILKEEIDNVPLFFCVCVLCTIGSSRHLHMPGYYVAVDHADKSVVLALRGTASVKVGIKHRASHLAVTPTTQLSCCTVQRYKCHVYERIIGSVSYSSSCVHARADLACDMCYMTSLCRTLSRISYVTALTF
jgi:hypothetical protein